MHLFTFLIRTQGYTPDLQFINYFISMPRGWDLLRFFNKIIWEQSHILILSYPETLRAGHSRPCVRNINHTLIQIVTLTLFF